MTFRIRAVDPTFAVPGRLAGRVLVVTGAARGMGAAVAVRAAREGAAVVCLDVLADELAATVAAIDAEGGAAVGVVGDVRDPSDTDAMVETAVRRFGRVDLACNAAGVMDASDPRAPVDVAAHPARYPAGAADADDEYWSTVMAVNATGVFNSCRSELRALLRQGEGGSIVNIASIAGLTGLPGNPAYSASKYAVQGLTKSIAVTYAANGIRCNSVGMAATATPMIERAMQFVQQKAAFSGGASGFAGGPGSKNLSLQAANDPGRAPNTVWEQAAPILFLLSDEGSAITGATLPTDGGWTAY